MRPSFHILTIGCQMNVRDSEWIASMLRARGMVESAPEDADIILLNTCSVREKPERRVKTALDNLEKKWRGTPLVGVLGCVAQQLGKKLYEFSPAVRLVAGGDGVPMVPGAVEELLASPRKQLEFLDFSREFQERETTPEPAKSGSAFVNIMQGCDNFCAYCIVPFTRGRQKSRSMDAILAECESRVRNGALDITLLGQNVNAYGQDKKGASVPFAELLRNVAQLQGIERLHFVTPHPKDFDSATVKAFEDIPILCPQLHLPLQSGSDRILKAMGRHYTRARYLKLVKDLRNARPDIAFCTDLIVGFPGETEADFEDTLELMREVAYCSSYSFCYSDRPGTRASRMGNKISPEIMAERLFRLQSLQDELSAQWLKARIGLNTSILVEKRSPRQTGGQTSWQGRDPYGAIVHVELPQGEYAGKMLDVEITAAKKHSLMGKIVRL